MAYVRSKKINGRVYYYLVKSVRDGNKVRQINLAYLGAEKPTEEEIRKIKKRYKRSKSR
ncbi:MAG: 2-C-methyl-D-erythritol 4-phosphate cytidylyltransferase [Candidatus Altiarchaeales archaeon]|nr:MAG: 2-C-methyl-D-erythritol 4-phosphate cytidylyltransferase [Candidatus Altiarchaeales archaeon]